MRRRDIHIVLDSLSTHTTAQVRAFLEELANVNLYFTSTYSSWLNQVAICFAKIETDVIPRGVFTSVKKLKRELVRYIRRYNETPRPIKWSPPTQLTASTLPVPNQLLEDT